MNDEKWSLVFGHLQPYLRPYGDSSEGRLDFYHRALSKAVRQRYKTVVDMQCCLTLSHIQTLSDTSALQQTTFENILEKETLLVMSNFSICDNISNFLL